MDGHYRAVSSAAAEVARAPPPAGPGHSGVPWLAVVADRHRCPGAFGVEVVRGDRAPGAGERAGAAGHLAGDGRLSEGEGAGDSAALGHDDHVALAHPGLQVERNVQLVESDDLALRVHIPVLLTARGLGEV